VVKHISENTFRLVSILIILFFSSLFLIQAFQIEHVLIGVVVELLTIPLLLLLAVTFGWGGWHLLKRQYKNPSSWLCFIGLLILTIALFIAP